jgi:hypothetical protein
MVNGALPDNLKAYSNLYSVLPLIGEAKTIIMSPYLPATSLSYEVMTSSTDVRQNYKVPDSWGDADTSKRLRIFSSGPSDDAE